MRKVLTIVAVLILGLVQQHADAQPAYRDAIEQVLVADEQTSLAPNISLRIREMQAINLSACPPEFRTAYSNHIYAWLRRAKIEGALNYLNSGESINRTLTFSVLADIFGSSATPIRDHDEQVQALREQWQEANGQVTDTYREIEHLAVMYNAPPPPRARRN